MIIENPPSPAQLQRLEAEKLTNANVLQAQSKQNSQTEQDLINALLLQKIAELEAKLANLNSYGDSGDVIS